MDSLWHQTVKMPEFEPLKSDLKTDVLIIGGGIAGLLCAYELSKAGVDCVLVEQEDLCGSVTRNTTAKITAQHGLVYDKLIGRFGEEKARLYLDANIKALENYRSICNTLECDFEESDSYIYTLIDRKKIEKELDALNRLGFDEEFVNTLPIPFPVLGAVRFRNQAQFHPLKFAQKIAEGLKIHTQTKVLELAPGKVVTNRGIIRAEKVIIATHFPMLNKHGAYFLKLYQHRSYVIAVKNASAFDGMYADEAKDGLSFRRCGDLLIIGGGSHRTGKKGGGWREIERFVAANYPKAQIVSRWATQDCMSLDGVPYIGQYSKNTPDLYVATGFNKWGMTSSMAAAMILTDMVQGKESPYTEVFSPARTIMRPQLAVNIFETTVSLLTPTVPRCPHMGCALKYNREEHSWDCSCHGSRFAEDGRVINNPAVDDKRM